MFKSLLNNREELNGLLSKRPLHKDHAKLVLYVGGVNSEVDLCVHGTATNQMKENGISRGRSIGEQVSLVVNMYEQSYSNESKRIMDRFLKRSQLIVNGKAYSLADTNSAAIDLGFSSSITREVCENRPASAKDSTVQGIGFLYEEGHHLARHTGSLETIYLLAHNHKALAQVAKFAQDKRTFIHYCTPDFPTASGTVGIGDGSMRTMYLGRDTHNPVGLIQGILVHSGAQADLSINTIPSKESIAAAQGHAILSAAGPLISLQEQIGIARAVDEAPFIKPYDISTILETRDKLDEVADNKQHHNQLANEIMVNLGMKFIESSAASNTANAKTNEKVVDFEFSP